MLHNNDVV